MYLSLVPPRTVYLLKVQTVTVTNQMHRPRGTLHTVSVTIQACTRRSLYLGQIVFRGCYFSLLFFFYVGVTGHPWVAPGYSRGHSETVSLMLA